MISRFFNRLTISKDDLIRAIASHRESVVRQYIIAHRNRQTAIAYDLKTRDEAILTALQFGNDDILKLILAEGISLINTDCYRFLAAAIHPSASSCSTVMIKALVSAGADINATDYRGYRVLYYALDNTNDSDLTIIETLVDAGISLKAGLYDSPLIRAINLNRMNTLRYFIKKGADVNQRLIEMGGTTPLMHAVFMNNADAVLLLLEAGADVTAVSSEKMTALMYALRNETDERIITALNQAVIQQQPLHPIERIHHTQSLPSNDSATASENTSITLFKRPRKHHHRQVKTQNHERRSPNVMPA